MTSYKMSKQIRQIGEEEKDEENRICCANFSKLRERELASRKTVERVNLSKS